MNPSAPRLEFWIVTLFLTVAVSAAALDSSDLLFDLSFDCGIVPDFARGSGEPALGGDPLAVFGEAGKATGGAAKSLDKAKPRLVDGLIGKGYRFGGKASTIEYYTGEHGRRGCNEMYGPKATIESLGQPEKGRLEMRGRLLGPAGRYTVKLHGKGFAEQTAVDAVDGKPQPFEIRKQLAKPDDQAAIVEVLAPGGNPILVRTIPFVHAATSQVELINYPGWGKLDVSVTPVTPEREGLQATVALLQGTNVVARQEIAKFDDPIQQVRFETAGLAAGTYEVVTTLQKGGQTVGEDRQPYTKKPLPEWYHNRVGLIEGPPVPWTDVQARGSAIQLLLKEITFQKTLFPSQIVSNGQTLLNGPMRLRVKRDGQEKVISAGDFQLTERTRRRAGWLAVAQDGDLKITVKGWTEFDGFTWCDIICEGGKVEHATLEIPLRRECATLKQVLGKGLLGDQPIRAPFIGWLGNEKAGLQVGWDHEYAWVKDYSRWPPNGELCSITPAGTEVVAAIPFIQKETTLDKPRTVHFYWAISPTKPLRKDWRRFDRYGLRAWTGSKQYSYINYGYVDWCAPRPNYPRTIHEGEERAKFKQGLAEQYQRDRRDNIITCWYAYGPYTWIGSPEYAEWWREWRDTGSQLAPPDPNSTAWGPACLNSSASDLFIWLLDRYVKEFACRGLYFDCMGGYGCANEAHGCGFVDEQGRRIAVTSVLAARRHYERIYNLIKAADPEYGWIRMHDWGPSLPVAAFCDENWVGEGLIGPVGSTPEKNYYRVVDLPGARLDFRGVHYGHLTAWLGELAVSAGTDPQLRSEWYGREVEPGKDGKPGKWILPRWKDYEHECGLSFVNDPFIIGGNEMPLPAMRLAILQAQLNWGPDVDFIGYWELSDRLEVGGGVAEKIVCSIYCRPPFNRKSKILPPARADEQHRRRCHLDAEAELQEARLCVAVQRPAAGRLPRDSRSLQARSRPWYRRSRSRSRLHRRGSHERSFPRGKRRLPRPCGKTKFPGVAAGKRLNGPEVNAIPREISRREDSRPRGPLGKRAFLSKSTIMNPPLRSFLLAAFILAPRLPAAEPWEADRIFSFDMNWYDPGHQGEKVSAFDAAMAKGQGKGKALSAGTFAVSSYPMYGTVKNLPTGATDQAVEWPAANNVDAASGAFSLLVQGKSWDLSTPTRETLVVLDGKAGSFALEKNKPGTIAVVVNGTPVIEAPLEAPNRCHHLVVCWESGAKSKAARIALYDNRKLLGAKEGATLPAVYERIVLGQLGTGPGTNKTVDDFAIYRRPLLQGEITKAYYLETKIELPKLATVPVAAKPPRIDGIFDPGEWDPAAEICGFVDETAGDSYVYWVGTGKPWDVKDTIRLMYDGKCLYFAYHCPPPDKVKGNEPIIAAMLKNTKSGFDTDVDADDVLFIDVHKPYPAGDMYHLIVNGMNTHYEFSDGGRAPGSREKGRDLQFNPKWITASTLTMDGWKLEGAIPFADLKMAPPKPGDVLHINFLRLWRTVLSGIVSWAHGVRHGPNDELYYVPAGQIRFAAPGEVTVQLEQIGNLAQGNLDFHGRFLNGGAQPAKVRVELTTNSGEANRSQEVEVPANGSAPLEFKARITRPETGEAILRVTSLANNTLIFASGHPLFRPDHPNIYFRKYPSWSLVKFEADFDSLSQVPAREITAELEVVPVGEGQPDGKAPGGSRAKSRGKSIAKQKASGFEFYAHTFEVSTAKASPGPYEATIRFTHRGKLLDTARQAFEIKPSPASANTWRQSRSGIRLRPATAALRRTERVFN